ncbi:ribonuclease M5 [Clostridium acetobutylicum]|uniref:Ribonuclease M5 n=1 Tax=Clostridium acetobutylicum (strain ATCC 824 / DSM 792 / JCM 1419 / IAM 19013 / LMG 5710 / NBRC 13948 / NRRL B-527 / VKM B-1787 / 2291 / W) TaxID=272562 RepID=RNM5_CLOAB|nr:MULTISPECIES: ribonuclease M5 [Clostridium]Q97EW9.1 RecName: Full=Ribonuclease M5; AltName: Full=RNase M5; AltName: Full=Ribosomal RNA terminal maturase M5 [Clostridium acetobutylicum ATCC 824]AAK80928.1 Primase-like protein, containing TOPRIM domain, YABF B.subtilis ortholog [Clostridium acetobutylicum ATCC 824]AEI33338.1 primase-like protein [Clostridium acetobutylicum DSM 1731]AWV78660.1 ribonuclease M5 [Clostridium acetobutylicum]KHD37288.1 DNA primase [Clostridium acetobutylicum]MBC23
MIKEVIVVEGRDDITAVKRAVDAEMIAVGGFGINSKIISKIKEAQKRRGVIVLTDPDFAGEKIRSIISKRVKGIKHARISQSEGTKNGDIGVENASPESIIRALNNAKCETQKKTYEFTIEDMLFFKLVGNSEAKKRRDLVGNELGIGYSNGAQFLSRLNNFGISKEELINAVNTVNRRYYDEGI